MRTYIYIYVYEVLAKARRARKWMGEKIWGNVGWSKIGRTFVLTPRERNEGDVWNVRPFSSTFKIGRNSQGDRAARVSSDNGSRGGFRFSGVPAPDGDKDLNACIAVCTARRPRSLNTGKVTKVKVSRDVRFGAGAVRGQ